MAYSTLWIDGFDETASAAEKYTATTERSSTFSTDSSLRAYGYGRSINIQNGWLGKLFASPQTVLFLNFDLLLHSSAHTNSDNAVILTVWDALAAQMQLDFRLKYNPVYAAFDLILRRGSTDIYTWAAALKYQSWQTVNLKIVIDPAVGSVELAIDGSSKGSFSGNTRNTVNTRADQLRLGYSFNNNASRFDNLVILTGLVADPILTPTRVYGGLVPNANVAVEWTPNGAASNWQCADEIPPNTSDYNSTSTPLQRDAFSHAALTFAGSTVLTVKANAHALKINTADADQIQTLVRVGATDYYGSLQAMTTSYFTYGTLFDTNPNTLLAWTPADAIAAGFGYRMQ